ncbi:hypothetical protein ACFL59_07325 [Planctomycetota bacterium]
MAETANKNGPHASLAYGAPNVVRMNPSDGLLHLVVGVPPDLAEHIRMLESRIAELEATVGRLAAEARQKEFLSTEEAAEFCNVGVSGFRKRRKKDSRLNLCCARPGGQNGPLCWSRRKLEEYLAEDGGNGASEAPLA